VEIRGFVILDPHAALKPPNRWAAAGIFALVFAMGCLLADIVPGSVQKDWPANLKRHVVRLNRTPSDEASLKRITIAENASTGTNAWSQGTQLGIRLPFALTHPALEYYEALVLGYQKRSWKTFIEPRSLMDYSAAVSHHETFERDGKTFREVDVVELKLAFHADFTQEGTQGVHFTKTRTVVLDRKSTVIAVFGDGPAEAPVLAI